MEVVREYCDAGRSGMSIKGRPAFMEMMDDISCEKDEISCVLVFKLSRFGRNAAYILKSVQLLHSRCHKLDCNILMLHLSHSRQDSKCQPSALWRTVNGILNTGQAKHGKVCRVSGKNDPEVRGCGSGGD